MLRAFVVVVVVVAVLVIGCSSSKQPPPSPAPVAPVAPVAIDAFVPDAPRPDAPSTAAVIDAAPPVDAGAKPITKRTPHRPCPACGIGCPHGVPSRATDENGCTVCACEDLLPRP